MVHALKNAVLILPRKRILNGMRKKRLNIDTSGKVPKDSSTEYENKMMPSLIERTSSDALYSRTNTT